MGDVIKSISIENFVRQRDAVIGLVAEAKELVDRANQICESMGLSPVSEFFNNKRAPYDVRLDSPGAVEEIAKRLDSAAWSRLMNESGIRTLMDAQARDEWSSSVHEMRTPPLTMPNVTSTFHALHDGRDELFARGVISCFRNLSWDYKTNQPFKFGKRLVIRSLFEAFKGTELTTPVHRSADELDDLVRVFSVLDGRLEPDHRHGMHYHLSCAANAYNREISLDYFSIRYFMNGNGHLTFSRPDLVEQMNLIIARRFPNALACENR
jgi:hypothetical protein